MVSRVFLASATAVFGAALFLASGIASAQSARLSDPEEQYINAVRNADFDKAQFYVEEGFTDPRNLSNGRSLVTYLYGCRSDNCVPDTEVLEYLISLGLNFDIQIKNGMRPISYVCQGYYAAANNTRLLAGQGVELNFSDENGLSPLHYCTQKEVNPTANQRARERWETLERTIVQLIKSGADVNARTQGDVPLVRNQGPYSRIKYGTGQTPLMLAAYSMNVVFGSETALLEVLLANGADVNMVDSLGNTAVNYLGYPERSGAIEDMLKTLSLFHGAGADIMNDGSNGSMFKQAVANGDVEFAQQIRAIANS